MLSWALPSNSPGFNFWSAMRNSDFRLFFLRQENNFLFIPVFEKSPILRTECHKHGAVGKVKSNLKSDFFLLLSSHQHKWCREIPVKFRVLTGLLRSTFLWTSFFHYIRKSQASWLESENKVVNRSHSFRLLSLRKVFMVFSFRLLR